MKLKLMYVVPHLSTGGMPQFVLKRIEYLQKFNDKIEIFLVEYSQFSTTFIVQRNKIINLLGDNFFSLGSFTEKERKIELIDLIKKNNIDIVHFEEIPEGFESFNKVSLELLNILYDNSRNYKIVETCHNIWYDANNNKKFNPDYYCFVTPYHLKNLFDTKKSPKDVITYPLENKVDFLYEKNNIIKTQHKVPLIEKLNVREELGLDITKTHILNVGLWTEGKNQKEGIEIAKILEKSHPNLQFHFVGNQAENFEYYWKPIMETLPSNVKIWEERDDVDKFMIASDVLMFNSLVECNPLVVREAISFGMKIITRNHIQYMGMFDNYIVPIETNDYEEISYKLIDLINSEKSYVIENQNDFGLELLNFYNKVISCDYVKNEKQENNYTINQHFVRNPFLEINGQSDAPLEVTFFDNNTVIYKNNIDVNSWIKLNRQYFTNWRTEVKENGNIVYNSNINLKNKRVYISFGSKSLGDTLAWIPYCEEFRLKHNCELIVSTFMNYLFVKTYPDIKFVTPGEIVPNIHAQYDLGWFYNNEGSYDENKHPIDFKTQPLQKTATDILGLEYSEIRPKLNLPKVNKKKKVGIGFHSTAQAKYWNNPEGWQQVVDYLNSLGYECMIYSKEGDGYMGNKYPKNVKIYKGGNLNEVIKDLLSCEFFIGLGSGLSWLSWACKIPTVLISGFSEKWAETKLDTYRVINENVCHGCFNRDRLDASDWNWCPLHKGSNRQYECTKKITSEMVIKEINKIMNKEEVKIQADDVSFDWGKKSDWYVSQATKEIFEYNIYERLFEVEEGDIVVDLGASLGPFTYSILPKNPKQCYVVEPLSYHIEILKKNLNRSNVKIVQGAITDKKKIEVTWDGITEEVSTFSFKEFLTENNITKIDFLKCDCEGGEYDVFSKGNIKFLKSIPKIVVEFHLNNDEDYHQCKFRWFRDNVLPMFENFEVFSLDGVDIKWDLYNEHFIEYYNEVLFYFKN